MEPPFYYEMKTAAEEMNEDKLNQLGPFA